MDSGIVRRMRSECSARVWEKEFRRQRTSTGMDSEQDHE